MIEVSRRLRQRADDRSQRSDIPSVKPGLGQAYGHCRDPRAMPLEPSAKRVADMPIVNKAAHTGSSCRVPSVRFTLKLIAL
jgi:hypothetical protein